MKKAAIGAVIGIGLSGALLLWGRSALQNAKTDSDQQRLTVMKSLGENLCAYGAVCKEGLTRIPNDISGACAECASKPECANAVTSMIALRDSEEWVRETDVLVRSGVAEVRSESPTNPNRPLTFQLICPRLSPTKI